MKLVGIRTNRRVDVAVQIGDRVTPIAEVSDFYDDVEHHLAVARKLTSADTPLADVTLAPPIPPSARVNRAMSSK